MRGPLSTQNPRATLLFDFWFNPFLCLGFSPSPTHWPAILYCTLRPLSIVRACSLRFADSSFYTLVTKIVYIIWLYFIWANECLPLLKSSKQCLNRYKLAIKYLKGALRVPWSAIPIETRVCTTITIQYYWDPGSFSVSAWFSFTLGIQPNFIFGGKMTARLSNSWFII